MPWANHNSRVGGSNPSTAIFLALLFTEGNGATALPFALGDCRDDTLGPKDQGGTRWRAECDLLGLSGMGLTYHPLINI